MAAHERVLLLNYLPLAGLFLNMPYFLNHIYKPTFICEDIVSRFSTRNFSHTNKSSFTVYETEVKEHVKTLQPLRRSTLVRLYQEG